MVIKDKEQFLKKLYFLAIGIALVTKHDYVINRDLPVFIKNSVTFVMRNKAKKNILDFAIK